MSQSDRVLSAELAARLIYNTRTPTGEQVAKVKDKIHRRVLAPGPRGQETTTAGAVAAYLSHKAAAAAASERPGARRFSDGAPVPGFYKDLLKDYFLAVLLQRTKQRRSRWFARGVMAMQLVVALLPIVVFFSVYRSGLRAMIKSPARIAAERWLNEQPYAEFDINQLRALETPPDAVELRYWYRQQGAKRMESVRILTLDGDRVLSATMPE